MSYPTDRYQSIKIGSLSDVCKLLFGIPQCSVLGPLLFSFYTTTLSLIISKHKAIKFHFYADESQVYIHLYQKNASAAFEKLNRCLDDVKEWMSTSKLKLNPDKTEFIIFGSKRQRDNLKACFPIDILGSPLCPVDSVKNLGVWFDSDFSLSKHVQNVPALRVTCLLVHQFRILHRRAHRGPDFIPLLSLYSQPLLCCLWPPELCCSN